MNESRSEALFQKTQWVWKTNSNWKIAHIDSAISGRNVKFHSKGSFTTAIVYGDKPMSAGQYYWEVKFTSPVFGTDMMLGVGTSAATQMNFERDYVKALGIDCESWGLSYRGSLWHDGKIQKDGVEYGAFTQGTVIGLHLDLWNGTLAYYIDGNYLGIAFDNLQGKILYPMACSTAAYSSLSLLCTQFYSSSLTYFSSAALRKHVPPELNVLDVLDFPPGLKKLLRQNLGWLLLPLKNKRNSSNQSTVKESSNPSTSRNNSSGRRRHSLFWTLTNHIANAFNSNNSDDETTDNNAGSTSTGLVRRRRTDRDVRNMRSRSSTDGVVTRKPKVRLQTGKNEVTDQDAGNMIGRSSTDDVVKLSLQTGDSAGNAVPSSSQVVADQSKIEAADDSCPKAGIDKEISTSPHKTVRCESSESNNKRKACDDSNVSPQTDDAVKRSSSAYKVARCENRLSARREVRLNSVLLNTFNTHDMSESDSSDNEETCAKCKSFDYMMGLDCSD